MNVKFEQIDQSIRDWKNSNTDWQQLINLSKTIKDKAQADKDEENANLAWFYEATATVHSLYLEAFAELKNRKYYQAWVLLEQIEIELIFINKNYYQETNDYGLLFLKNIVDNYQAIYPYKIFFSGRYEWGSLICSICNEKVTFAGNCRHREGKLYNGELCIYNKQPKQIITFDIVRHPVNKFAVAFTENEFIKGLQDQYYYTMLVFALASLQEPYEEWCVNTEINYRPHNPAFSPNDPCPCDESFKYYKDCCMNKPGIEYKHKYIDVLISPEEHEKRLKLIYPIYPFSSCNPY